MFTDNSNFVLRLRRYRRTSTGELGRQQHTCKLYRAVYTERTWTERDQRD